MWLALLALLTGPSAHAADCGLLDLYPHRSVATLSNGVQIPVPTQARKVASYVLFGTLDPAQAASGLPEGLAPIVLDGHAFGALSIFDYQDSDLGVFREGYFVIVAGKGQIPAKPALYHLKAWSTSETARLASSELWGIPMNASEIDIDSRDSKKVFQVRSRDIPVIDMTWAEAPSIPNPFAYFFSVDAVGPGDGTAVTSPIAACGASTIASYSAGDTFVVHDRSLDVLLKALAFKPMAKALFDDEQAIQFAATSQ